MAVIEGVLLENISKDFSNLARFFKRVHLDLSIMRKKCLTVNEFKPLVTQVLSGRSDLDTKTFYDNYLAQSVRDKVDKMCTDIYENFTAPDEGVDAFQVRFRADQARVVSLPEFKVEERRGTKRKQQEAAVAVPHAQH